MSKTLAKKPEQSPAELLPAKLPAKAKPETSLPLDVKALAAAKPVKAVAVPAKSKATPVIKAKQEVSTASSVKVKAVAQTTTAPEKAKLATPETKIATPAASKAAVKAKPAVLDKESKEKKVADKKPKLVRDSFTFPEADYAQLGILKQRAMKAGHAIKKSELLRAGLTALSLMSDAALLQALDGIDKLKPGRPAK